MAAQCGPAINWSWFCFACRADETAWWAACLSSIRSIHLFFHSFNHKWTAAKTNCATFLLLCWIEWRVVCLLMFASFGGAIGGEPPITHQKNQSTKQPTSIQLSAANNPKKFNQSSIDFISFVCLGAAMPVNNHFSSFFSFEREEWKEKLVCWMGCGSYIGPCSSRLNLRTNQFS